MQINPEALRFLKDLKENNNREWYEPRKVEFKKLQTEIKEAYQSIVTGLNEHDEVEEKYKLYRIYRDVRFSKDKTPFQPHFAGGFKRAGAARRGGYYLRIRPGESFMAIGFWQPNKEDLLRIRKEFELDASEMREILADKDFKSVWGNLEGDEVKTAPKGFSKDHENIDLIKKKGFVFSHSFTDAEVLEPGFLDTVVSNFEKARPYLDYMSSVVTTNLNGESLL